MRPLVLIVCICIVKPPPVSRFHPWSHLDDQRGDSTPEDEELLAVSDPKLVASEAVSLPPTASTSDPLPSPSLPALLLSELRPPPHNSQCQRSRQQEREGTRSSSKAQPVRVSVHMCR